MKFSREMVLIVSRAFTNFPLTRVEQFTVSSELPQLILVAFLLSCQTRSGAIFD